MEDDQETTEEKPITRVVFSLIILGAIVFGIIKFAHFNHIDIQQAFSGLQTWTIK